MFPFENMNPLKQRKSKKEFSLCKTFLEKFKNFNRRDSLCFSVCKSASFIFLFLGLSLLKQVLPIIRIAFDGKYIEMDFSENLEMKPKFEVEDANFSIFPTSYLLCTVQQLNQVVENIYITLVTIPTMMQLLLNDVLEDILKKWDIKHKTIIVKTGNVLTQYKNVLTQYQQGMEKG